MKHRIKTRKLNRDTKHRKALLRNLVRELVEHGAIKTTVPKAKETKRLADKLIGKAKDDSIATRRQLHQFFGKRDVVNTLVERVAPVFTKRTSGFTRIVRVGRRRGDNTQVVKLELVKQPENMGSLRNPKPEPKPAKTAKTAAKTAAKKPTKKTAKKPTKKDSGK